MSLQRALSILAALLSLLGPLLVFTVSYDVIMRWRDLEEWTADQNAGRVFNAKVIDGGAPVAMERLLALRDPEVIVLGPSYANTDVRVELLAARLSISKDKIAMMSVPNSTGAHWYAMLKYRVFGNGYRPKLIVVVSGLQSMLLTTPLTESSFVNLEVQLPEGGDPVISQKVEQSTGLWWARVREQRGKVRSSWLDGVRDLAVTTLLPVNRVQARTALNRVFDDSNIDMRLHGASTPVVEANRGPLSFYTPDLLPTPMESFIPDITELVSAHGARVVWVRPPMSPHVPEELDDIVLDGTQEKTIEIVNQRGGSYVDMRSLPMTSAMFKDEDHMNTEGSRRFSEALANALLDLDAMHPVATPESLPPLQADLRLSGAGRAEGEPLTLLPGTTAAWSLPGWQDLRGSFGLEIYLQSAAFRDVTLSVAGTRVPLLSQPSSKGQRAHGELSGVPAPPGPFDVTLHVPEGHPPVEVLALSLGRKLRRAFLIGDEASLQGRSIRLLGVTRVENGVLVDDSAHPIYLAPITKVPGHDRRVHDLPGEPAAYFETESWAFLSDEALMGESAYGSRCSPLRVTENGALLPQPNVPCADVKRKGHGRSCHTTDRIFFSAPDGSDPAHNGRTYRLVLDEGRRCDGAAWIYPVDKLQVSFPPEDLATLTEGAHFFTLSAKYLNFRQSMLLVRLEVDGQVRLETALDGRDLKLGPRTWPLDPPVPPTAKTVQLTLENTGHVFYLLDGLTLSER